MSGVKWPERTMDTVAGSGRELLLRKHGKHIKGER